MNRTRRSIPVSDRPCAEKQVGITTRQCFKLAPTAGSRPTPRFHPKRDKPSVRKKLKALKRKQQHGICPECETLLPETYCVLDRSNAADGYTVENTRLICQPCDIAIQTTRGYA